MTGDIRILIVADDPLVRSGLLMLLDGQPGCTLAGTASSGDRLDGIGADVILWDLGWDPPDGVVAGGLPGLGADAPPLVALLPPGLEPAQVRVPGLAGFLQRDVAAERLVAALAAVAQGLVVLDPEFAAPVLPTDDAPLPTGEELTAREHEVLQLLAEGLSNRAIGHELGISEHTVKFHVNAILGKLDAESRTEAVVRAMRLGLIVL